MNLPFIFQIRKNVIIGYADYSCLERTPQTINEKKEKNKKNEFSSNAKKRMKKIIDLWEYTTEGNNKKVSFITLTISSKMKGEVNYNKLLKIWLEKIIYRYGKMNYIWKCELQKNGNVHYHLIMEKEIDWKIIRGIWNKTQKIHVDEYQIKMKKKYKNGYYFDDEMIDYNGKIVEEEVQKRRYEKGKKANWRNPNSTDVKIIDTNNESVGSYINKYMTKNVDETEEEIKRNNINRFWGCNDELRLLKYCTINENELDINDNIKIQNAEIKKIVDEMYNVVCVLYDKCKIDVINEKEKTVKEENKKLITYDVKSEKTIINKEIKLYEKMFD